MTWLHPLAEYRVIQLKNRLGDHWEYTNEHVHVPVLWNGDVYNMIEGYRECKLLKYSTSNDSWSDYAIPCDIMVWSWTNHVHILTTYHSKLLLISGADNEVWEFDANESIFKPSPDITLPENWEYEHVAAASEGDYLLTIRRARDRSKILVNIFDGSTWTICDGPCCRMWSSFQVVLHNYRIFMADQCQEPRFCTIYEAPLHLLINNKSNVWQELQSTPQRPSRSVSNLTILDNHLCIACYDPRDRFIYLLCYLVDRKQWLESGNTTELFFSGVYSIVGLPDHNSMIMVSKGQYYKLKPGEPYKYGVAIMCII